jgi:hypothetical protein
MHLLVDDMRHALRSLQHGRAATLLAVGLFAVSIGVTTAIYAAVEAVMLRPGPLAAPDRTIVAWQRDDTRGTPVVVTMRRRELGVRAALGATPTRLRRHVLAEALWTAGGATVVGIAGALAVGRALQGFLVDTSPYDATSLLAAALITAGAGVAGCLLASHGAARANPVEALRD